MLKIIRLLNLTSKAFKPDDNKVVSNENDKTNKIIVNSFKNNKFRNWTCMPNIRAKKKPIFLTSNTDKTFDRLNQAFINAPIFQHFDL